jgi:hypothetical protein
MSSGASAETSGPKLSWVLGTIAVAVVVLGTLAYWRYTESERYFAESLADIDARAPGLSTEECVGEILTWHRTCAANGPLCDHGVPRVMTHCLAAADRTATCESLDLSTASAKWVFDKCEERGTPCTNRKKCACANAYRAIDSFCKHDQKGVSL